MRLKRQVEVFTLLSAIERELVRAGAEPGAVLERLSELIGELRDVLWHEMPPELGRRMDEEDGLDPERGHR
jgi:hypothetical protein